VKEQVRCRWVPADKPAYVRYHDEEWGRPVHDDRLLFEMLILEGAQAGGAVSLDVVEEPGGRRAEGDRQERERADDEHGEHDPADQGSAAPRGVPVGSGAPDRRAQHRHARGAVAGSHIRRVSARPAGRVLFPGTGGPRGLM